MESETGLGIHAKDHTSRARALRKKQQRARAEHQAAVRERQRRSELVVRLRFPVGLLCGFDEHAFSGAPQAAVALRTHRTHLLLAGYRAPVRVARHVQVPA